MRIEANRKQLLDAFKHVATLAGGQKEILNYVWTDGVSVYATDSEIAASQAFKQGVVPVGPFLLHAQRVGSILQELSCETVTIEVTDAGIRISGGDGEFNLPTANPDEYPRSVSFVDKPTGSASIDAAVLRDAVGLCSPCVDESNSRFALGGIRVELTDDGVRFVATDGRRLVKVGSDGDAIASAVVPVKAMQLAAKASGPVSVEIGSNGIEFQSNGGYVAARLIEGRYPDWRKVIPKKGGPEFAGASLDWFRCVKQAAICCDQESRGLNLQIGESKATMQARTVDVGASRCEVDCNGSGSLALLVDWRYLADFLRGVGDSVFTACCSGDASPIRFDVGEDTTCVLMPMSKDAT
jgi:DNA polymerase-3 subunit beta